MAREQVDRSSGRRGSRLSAPRGALRGEPGQPRNARTGGRPRGARQRQGPRADEDHEGDGGSGRRRDHPGRGGPRHRSLRGQRAIADPPARSHARREPPSPRPGDGRGPGQGRHDLDRRRRLAGSRGPLPGIRRRGQAGGAPLRDGFGACGAQGMEGAAGGARRRLPDPARGQALRRRSHGLARCGDARAVRRRPRELGPARHFPRGHPGSGALGPAPRLPGRDPRHRRSGQPHRPRPVRDRVSRVPRGQGPPLPDRARAAPRRGGDPPLRSAARDRVDAGHPRAFRPALGAGSRGHGPGHGRPLRVAQAVAGGSADRQRHRCSGRGSLGDPELLRVGDPHGPGRAAARRLRSRPADDPRRGAAHLHEGRRLRPVRGEGQGHGRGGQAAPTSWCSRATS